MPIVGISITKHATFRDSVQHWSNVYYYNNGVGSVPDAAGAGNLIDELVTFEKTIHSNQVTFDFGRCWHQTLLQLTTVMLNQKALSGVGATTSVSNFDRERAYLVQWRAGNDSRGNPVFLRKWYHSCGQYGGGAAAPTAQNLENVTGLSAAIKTAIESHTAQITDLSAAGGGWELCAKSGRGHDFNTPGAHPYLEHHQLGDEWRGD